MTTPSSLLCAVHHLRDRVGDPASDVELLRRYAQDHDQEAFAALVRRHGALVYNVARRQLRDLHHAEDVFQATFLALARSSARLGQQRSLTNWLYTVALRQSRKAKLREMRRAEIDQSRTPPRSGPTDPLEVISGRELVSLIDEEFERLPENYRLVLLLCCIQGLSREEAADRLGWSVGAVKGRLERGRHRLANQLAKKGIAPAVVLTPIAEAVPEPLMSRAVALAASPWAGSVPTRVVEILGLPSASKLLPVVALCFTLFALGLTTLLLQPRSGKSAPPAPGKPAQADAGPLTDPLPERAIRRFGSARYRHGERIDGLTVSSDERFAVAFGTSLGSRLAHASLFELQSGRRLAKLPGRVGSIIAAAFSPDGKMLATKQRLGIHFHNSRTGAEIGKIRVSLGNPRHTTYWLAYSPDGTKIALSYGWAAFQIVDLKTKQVLHRITHGNSVYVGAFSPDGKTFAAGGTRCVRLWDVATGKEIRRCPYGRAGLNSLAFSPDGKTLAGGGADHPVRAPGPEQAEARLRLWDVATGKTLHDFQKNGSHILGVAFSHDGKTIASAGETLRLYDTATKKERLRIPHRARNVHFSASDEVLTAAVDGAIHRWSTKTGRLLTPSDCNSGVDQIALINKGRTLLTRDQAGIIHEWDRATGKHLRQMRRCSRREFAVSPDGRYLVQSKGETHRFGRKLKLYDLEKRRFLERFPGYEGYIHDRELTRDGKTLVTVSHTNGKVQLWDLAAGKERRSFFAFRKDELKRSYLISNCVLSPDDKTLAVAYRNFAWRIPWTPAVVVRLWDITTGKELAELNGHAEQVHHLAFSPEGRFLASCAESPFGEPDRADAFFLWDVKARRRIVRFSDKGAPSAYRVAFSPDGRTLASASLDGTVRIWEVASWTLRTQFQAHRDYISSLHFASDGTLFTGSFDSTVLSWDLRPDRSVKDMSLPKAWTSLLDLKAGAAYAAQGRLLAAPKEAVAFLTRQLRPVARVDARRTAKLLADLHSDEFAVREAAFLALRKLGHQIEPTLREALARTSSLEVRRSVQKLLSRLEPTATPPAALRTLRAVEVLEWLATSSARELLSELAKGEPNALLTRACAAALQRMRAYGKQVQCSSP